MLYEGQTVNEALGAALGRKKSKYPIKPSTYGKPIGGTEKNPLGAKPSSKPAGSGKQFQEENRYATRDAIARARREAVDWAENYMRVQRTYGNGHEFGCYAVFDATTGRPRHYPRNTAGFGGGAHYRFNYHPSQGPLLVTGHSHPRESEADSRNPSGDVNQTNTILTEADLNDIDRRLLNWAPVVIKLPTNRSSEVSVFWGEWRGR